MVACDYRSVLQAETAGLHAEIDALFSRFDLAGAGGLTGFLAAHAIAMRACQPRLTRFARTELRCEAPDYARIVDRDLARLGCDAARLPRALLPPELDDAGVFYVVAGSRLGAAVLRERASAPVAGGLARDVCGYFAAGDGPMIWRAFRQWLTRQAEAHGGGLSEVGESDPDHALAAMIQASEATFYLFAHAAKLAGAPARAGGAAACA